MAEILQNGKNIW